MPGARQARRAASVTLIALRMYDLSIRLASLSSSLAKWFRRARCYTANDYWSMCGPPDTLLRAGLAWDFYGTTWAALHSIGYWRDSIKGLTEASGCGPDLVGPVMTTLLRHLDYGPANPRGNFHRPSIGTVTVSRIVGHPPHDSPGYVAHRGRGLEQRMH